MIQIEGKIIGFDQIEKAINDYMLEIANRLKSIGESYISHSKTFGSYQNRTNRLRGAHSYRVSLDGRVLFEYIGSLPGGEINPTRELFDENMTNKGLQLLVGDGMNYASFVEGKGFNVSDSGFRLVENQVRNIFK